MDKKLLDDSSWGDAKKALLDGLSPGKQSIVDTILQNQRELLEQNSKNIYNNAKPLTEEEEADEIIRRLSAPPTPVWNNSIIMPMIRRIIPGVIASEIVGVQPMTGPVGQVFSMRVKYSDGKDDLPEE